MKLCVLCKDCPVRISGQRKQSYCVECNRRYGKKNYQENKSRYFKQAHERTNQIRTVINIAKSKPCADCGKTFHPCVMDFDHLNPKEKIKDVSYMFKHKWALDKIMAEISKCEVVCSNCHRLRSYFATNRVNANLWANAAFVAA